MDIDPLSLMWCALIAAEFMWGAAGYLVLHRGMHYTLREHRARMEADGVAGPRDADRLRRFAYWTVVTTSLLGTYLTWPLAIARIRRNRGTTAPEDCATNRP